MKDLRLNERNPCKSPSFFEVLPSLMQIFKIKAESTNIFNWNAVLMFVLFIISYIRLEMRFRSQQFTCGTGVRVIITLEGIVELQ